MPNLVLVPQSEVLTPIFQVSCPTIGGTDSGGHGKEKVRKAREGYCLQ